MSLDPEYEKTLRRRLALLKEQLEAGRIQFAPDLKAVESLKDVRYGPDGEIDLATVDSSVRALALAIEATHHREEAKKVISLRDLQHGYFRVIESNFGQLHRQMLDEGLTPFQVGSGVSEDPEGVRIFHKAIPGILDWVKGLWSEANDVAHIHAQDVRGFKAVFGGETFPQGSKNIVSSSGVYVDSIVLPDPFIRSDFLLTGEVKAAAVRSLITSALSLLQYKNAVLAEIDTPLAIIVPDSLFLNESMRDTVFQGPMQMLSPIFQECLDEVSIVWMKPKNF